jgi:hypothetical protein
MEEYMMYSLYFLPTARLAAPKFAVWPIKGFVEREFRDRTPSVSQRPFRSTIVPASSSRPARVTRWISISEFVGVLTHRSDLHETDLRKSAEVVPFSELTAPIPLMAQFEPYRGLERPSEKIASMSWDPSDFDFLALEVSSWMGGSSLLHLLEGDLSIGEVA